MKKLLICFLSLLILTCTLFTTIASDVTQYIKGQGYTPEVTDNADGSTRCDFIMAGSAKAVMEWSDSTSVYSITGSPNDIVNLYVAALDMGFWDSCRYVVGKKARVSYGVKSKNQCDDIDEYKDTMADAFTGQTGVSIGQEQAAPSTDDGRDYVLNTNSKKFHNPNCSSVGKMKEKNRKNYHGSRDDLIAQGYAPCGNCNP